MSANPSTSTPGSRMYTPRRDTAIRPRSTASLPGRSDFRNSPKLKLSSSVELLARDDRCEDACCCCCWVAGVEDGWASGLVPASPSLPPALTTYKLRFAAVPMHGARLGLSTGRLQAELVLHADWVQPILCRARSDDCIADPVCVAGRGLCVVQLPIVTSNHAEPSGWS